MSLDAVYDRMRHRDAAEAGREQPVSGDFESLRSHKHCLLVTFRRSGEPVATPVWFGFGDEGRVYIRTAREAAKVKRVARDPRVRVAPCSPRGKPLGKPIEGHARVVPAGDEAQAEHAIQSNYGLGRRVYKGAVARHGFVYLEVTPT